MQHFNFQSTSKQLCVDHNDRAISRVKKPEPESAVAKALEMLGEKAWTYMPDILEKVQEACKYAVEYKTFKRWCNHSLKFGEVPAATRRRGGMKAFRGRRVVRALIYSS